MVWHKTNPGSQRLAQIPGIGPIGAAMLIMKTPAPETFRSGRQSYRRTHRAARPLP
jgi:transposase